MIDDRDVPGGDATIESIARALRPLPRVDDAAKARVLIAVAAERERAREAAVRRVVVRRRVRSYAGVAALMAASALAAVWLRPSADPAPAVASAPAAVAPAPEASTAPAATLASGDEGALDAAPQPVQLVFRAPAAAQVRVVGDFNAWDGSKAAMTRDAESGLWSITLSLRPGRHVYAFLVDDSLWVRDPRAPAAPDADFGREGSVLLVGRPR